MAEEDDETVENGFAGGQFTSKLDLRFLKPGAKTFISPISHDLAVNIGLIVVQWGTFEQRMDFCIEHFYKWLYTRPILKWQRLPFRKRKELFRDLSKLFLIRYRKYDQIRPLALMCGVAADLQWRRNIVAHGTYMMYPSLSGEKNDPVRVVAYGLHKSKEVQIEMREDVLMKLYQDIAHLNGDLSGRMCLMGVQFLQPEIIVDDTTYLQEQKGHTTYFPPTPNTI